MHSSRAAPGALPQIAFASRADGASSGPDCAMPRCAWFEPAAVDDHVERARLLDAQGR